MSHGQVTVKPSMPFVQRNLLAHGAPMMDGGPVSCGALRRVPGRMLGLAPHGDMLGLTPHGGVPCGDVLGDYVPCGTWCSGTSDRVA